MVSRCDVLAVAAHPDDAELGCGATLARLAAAGKLVGVLDLTAGEGATRGSVEARRAEAAAAARALGVAWRTCLGLPDGGSRPSARNRSVPSSARCARRHHGRCSYRTPPIPTPITAQRPSSCIAPRSSPG
jgi:LmbE family N-acetylglucosaminyl deacetylase